MLRHLFTIIFIFPTTVFAQTSDCVNAISIVPDSTYHSENITGQGNTIEFSGNELGNKFYFTEEHNTIYYLLTASIDGVLSLDITPDNIQDDWDFLLFDGNSNNACEEIKNKTRPPLRTNLSRNNPLFQSKTGISKAGSEDFIPAGPNNSYSNVLKVTAGSKYILVVDNNKASGRSHKIRYQIAPKKIDSATSIVKKENSPLLNELGWVNEKEKGPQSKYTFKVFDKETKKPLNCNLTIVIEVGFGSDSTIVFRNENEVQLSLANSINFSLNITKQGYMFLSHNYRTARIDSSFEFNYFMPKAKVGELISLPDINFKENTTHLLTNSIQGLQQIHDFMINNPNAIIEIRGHVNAPGYDNDGKVKRFSEKRADEVKDFLVGMGIESKRMKTVGLGNGEMIFPNPANYDQEKANRRVEIKILQN